MAEPPDQAARDRVATALDETLFVEAGAGSGKTRALVDRIAGLVGSGVDMGSIAAITFTEKAAAELRDRIHRCLSDLAREAGAGAERYRSALDRLDLAAISTLHAFAQRILREHALEAGLPPRVEVLDEVSSGIEFERRWSHLLDDLVDDDAAGRSILVFLAAGGRLDDLRRVAAVFGENWDLVERRVDRHAPEPDSTGLDTILAAAARVCGLADHCRNPDDKLLAHLGSVGSLVTRARAAPDTAEAVRLLWRDRKAGLKTNVGVKKNWPDAMCDQIRTELGDLDARLGDWVQTLQEACLHHLGAALARFTLAAADERRRDGRLEFHDLLVLARRMLRDPDHGGAVRDTLGRRYTHLLLDEFQDTDPIQIEIAVLIASDDPRAGEREWYDVAVRPGALFFVGDPKQSIYRFRRADISMFLRARRTFTPAPLELSTNFRSAEPVIAWVNAVFGDLICFEEGSQPEYIALQADRSAAPDGPAVVVCGEDDHEEGLRADGVRGAEAGDVVAAINVAVADKWSVQDRDGTWRAARLGDIAILLPARTSLEILETNLDAAGIPYRAESSSLVYSTRAIRDLVTTMRSVDDPSDDLATVTALRSPLFGCGDDDLFRWRHEYGGRWNHQAPPPDGVPADDPVAVAMAYLCELHRCRHWHAPSELIERVVCERRLLEAGFADGRPRDLWRRVRFVVDQARAWCDAEGGSLRGWLDWVERQSDEGGRVQESVLPETDDDSVRIMTIHAAKGLEFPIVILSGMSAQLQSGRGVDVHFPPVGGVAYRVSGIATEEYERFKPLDEQMSHHERLRLLYVACTRARDHLVVSVHRLPRRTPQQDPARMSNAELVLAALERSGAEYDTLSAAGDDPRDRLSIAAQPPPALAAEADWARERAAALASSGRPRTVSATAVAESAAAGDPGLDKRARDLDLPPWQKGRYGNAVGRAVHGVLQTVDLSTGDGIAAAAAAQAAAEGVVEHEAAILALAGHALGADCVVEAAASEHWRETYVAVPVGESTLEGYIDLLYRTAAGLVVVDYKTAGGADTAEIDARVQRYRLQGGSYALAVARATGEAVARCVFVFLTDGGAVERELDDLEAAMRDAEAAVTSGASPTPTA